VTIYGERAPTRSRGLIGPTGRYKWPFKHALEVSWWWINAEPWCQDNGDTLLPPPAKTITPNDGTLTCVTTAISADGLQAGFLLTGGTSAVDYTVTVRLIGRTTGASWSGDIVLPMDAGAAITAPTNDTATINASVLRVGGTTLAPGQAV
jgi:hypothetical protein